MQFLTFAKLWVYVRLTAVNKDNKKYMKRGVYNGFGEIKKADGIYRGD